MGKLTLDSCMTISFVLLAAANVEGRGWKNWISYAECIVTAILVIHLVFASDWDEVSWDKKEKKE